MSPSASLAALVRASLLALSLVVSTLAWARPLPTLPFEPVEVGAGTLRYYGFKIYDGKLWSPTGRWQPNAPFALELTYARAFDAADIARRSVDEMLRQRDFPDAQLKRWEAQMAAIFPDVKDGTRVTGVRVPGEGAVFFEGEKRLGQIRDEAFADAFFAIWLGEKTSAPKMRKALLGEAK
jgi:hypothetical protein